MSLLALFQAMWLHWRPRQTTAPPQCAAFSTVGLGALFRLFHTLESIVQYFKGLQNCATDKQWNHTYAEISKGTVMLPKPVLTAFNLPWIQDSSPSLLVHWSHTILRERAKRQIFRAAQHGFLVGTIQKGMLYKLLFHAGIHISLQRVRWAFKDEHVQTYATFVCFLVLALLSSICHRKSTYILWKYLSTNITFIYMNRRIWEPVLATCKWLCPPRFKNWRSMQVNVSIIKNNRKQTGNRIKSSSQLGSSNQWHQGIAEVIHWWVLN